MKYLLIFITLFLVYSCTKFENPVPQNELDIQSEMEAYTQSMKIKQISYRGHLAGEGTTATGQVNFKFYEDNNQVYYKLIVANIDDVTAAHLHHSHSGDRPGHPVLPLFSNDSGAPTGTVNGILSEGILTTDDINCNCDHDGPHDFAHLRKHIEDGETSVLVHTVDYPQGEINGDIH